MKEVTQKKEISKTEYLTLEGIRALSTQLNRQLELLVISTSDITREELDENNYGHAADFIFSPDEKVKEHLRKLGISVNKNKI
jgi:hypothetical protein